MRHSHLHRFGGELTLVLAVVLLTIVVAGVVVLGSEAEIVALLDWVAGRGVWGPALFAALYAVVVVLVMPSVLLTLGAGFLFGVVNGSLLVMVGETVGAVVAFLIGRHFLGDRFAAFLTGHPRLAALTSLARQRGWRVVMLTRLTPFFPGKLANYVFGLSRYSLSGFVVGNVIGIVPITVTNVYLGSLAADIATLGARGALRTPIGWVAIGGGLAVAAAVLIYAGHAAARALQLTKPAAPHAPSAADRTPP